MSTVRQIVSEAKHSDGLTQWKTAVLDLMGRDANIPEWLRRVRTWMELYAIDGTASGLSVVPFVEPTACYPEETGANSWIPVNPATGVAAILENEILTKLKTAKFVAYTNVQVNLANQSRIVFQVLLNSAISRQSQAAVKNSPEWAALSVGLNQWAELLGVIVRLHTVHRGADVEESRIVAKIRFETKLRSFKQSSGIDSGAHLERFDDLILEGKTIGANLDQKELAYLLVNSMKSNAARNKRTLLMEIGQPTPSSYVIAKAFVLEAEAMARSVYEFNSGYANGGHAAVTDAPDSTDKESGDSDELLNFATGDARAQKRVYTPLQKKHWKELPEGERKKVQALEEIADKIRSGEKMDFDVRTVASTLTSSTGPSTGNYNHCWKCKEPRDGPKGHAMKDCPMKDKIKGAPHAPPPGMQRARVRKDYNKKPDSKKRAEIAAIVESDAADDESEDDFYHLDTLVTDDDHSHRKNVHKAESDAGLFLDSDSEEDELTNICMITEEEMNEDIIKRLKREVKGLNEAIRIPDDEEITFQTDLINFPHLCKAVLANNKWDTVNINGVSVVKGGPFDTTGTRKATLVWNMPTSAAKEPAGSEIAKVTAVTIRMGNNDKQTGPHASDGKTTGQNERERYGTPPSTKPNSSLAQPPPTWCAGCAKLKEEAHTKSIEMHQRCSELMEMVKKDAEGEMIDLRRSGEKEMQKLREAVREAEDRLRESENNSRWRTTGTPRDTEIEGLNRSLQHCIERNSYLAESLESATKAMEAERSQCEFYKRTMKSDREEMRELQTKLSERQQEEEERVEVYRESCRIARLNNQSLRKDAVERVRNARSEEVIGGRHSQEKDRKRSRGTEEETEESESKSLADNTPSGEDTETNRTPEKPNDKGPPSFDASTMEDITPIFGRVTVHRNDSVDEPAKSNDGTSEVASGNDTETNQASGNEYGSEVDSASVQTKKEKKLQRELAKLASSNGINVDDFRESRKGRYQAEQTAAGERTNLKMLRAVIWDCYESLDVRERIRHTEYSITDVEERERGYRNILNKEINGYLEFLNDQRYEGNRPKVTLEWAQSEVDRFKARPQDRPKPVKIPMPYRSPEELVRRMEESRRYQNVLDAQSLKRLRQERENSARDAVLLEAEELGDEDELPALLDDDDSDEEDEVGEGNPGEKKESEVGLATHQGARETNQNGVESEGLTIHGHLVITLDNAASSHVFRDPELVHSARTIKSGAVSVGGLKAGGDGVICRKKGMFLSVNNVLLGKDSIANLLSQGTLVDQGHHVAYDTRTDIYIVRFKGTSVSLTFKRQKHMESDTLRKHYVCKMDPSMHHQETALIETIKERQSKYTKAEILEAARAREQSAMLNFPSGVAHLDLIKQASVDGNEVTAEALARSVDIWGRPRERSKGNNRYKKPTAAAPRLNNSQTQVARNNIAHADLLFVKGVVFLMIVLDPMKYVWIFRLLSKTTENIRIGVNRFFADMSSYKVNITWMRCDGEGGIWALESEVKSRGVLMDKAAAGKHVEMAEIKIKQVKEGVRRAASSLPYLLCRVLLIACVYHAVQCINLQRTNVQRKSGLLSPYNQLTGQKINAKIHLIAQFGTYVECTVRETDNSINDRTESAIYCSSALQATEANHLFVIKTNEMVLRGECEKKAMSQAMIAILDRKAVRDWGEQAKDIFFEEKGDIPQEESSEYEEERDEREEPGTEVQTAEGRVTRSMTVSAGGVEGYEIDRAAGRSTNVQRENVVREGGREEGLSPRDSPERGEGRTIEERDEDDSSETGVNTPVRESVNDGAFRESGYWDRNGKAESPGYFHEWQESAAKLDMGSSPSRGAAERHEVRFAQSTRNDVAAPLAERYEVLLAREARMRKDWYHKEYALVMSQKQAIKKLGAHIALPAISKELKQMLDKGVWEPVHWDRMTEQEKSETIPSSMFMKEKYYADGKFEKVKGRLVAGGNKQDRDKYDDLSSPTAKLSSLNSIVAIAACEGRIVETGDIPGAYLNSDMKEIVNMRLDRVVSEQICKLDPKYLKYLDSRGRLTVRLLKALYGCVESAKLWNDDLSKMLIDAGFVANPEDPCVFNKGSLADKNQITVIIYVDDLMATCLQQKQIDDLWAAVRKRFVKPGEPDIQVRRGKVINYLGMTFDWTVPGEVRITQLGFTAELVADSGVDVTKRAATSPAVEALFDTREDEEAGVIDEETKDWFHRFVAKSLYLAKRTRPEILTTVAFLCTRVTRSNLDDVRKLERLMSYLSGTKERGIVLRPGLRGMQVRVFVDAAYGVHADFKSSSGGTIVLGDAGPISATSCKQSIVTKSSMEAELVASSDLMNQPFHVKRLLVAQGYDASPIVLYQDNLSCMALIAKGRAGSERTRHISIRYYWIKQHVDSGEVVVEKLASEEMPANILTKPLQGSQFRYERKLLTNWED